MAPAHNICQVPRRVSYVHSLQCKTASCFIIFISERQKIKSWVYGNLGLQTYGGDNGKSWRRILLERHIGMVSCVLGKGQGREVEAGMCRACSTAFMYSMVKQGCFWSQSFTPLTSPFKKKKKKTNWGLSSKFKFLKGWHHQHKLGQYPPLKEFSESREFSRWLLPQVAYHNGIQPQKGVISISDLTGHHHAV